MNHFHEQIRRLEKFPRRIAVQLFAFRADIRQLHRVVRGINDFGNVDDNGFGEGFRFPQFLVDALELGDVGQHHDAAGINPGLIEQRLRRRNRRDVRAVLTSPRDFSRRQAMFLRGAFSNALPDNLFVGVIQKICERAIQHVVAGEAEHLAELGIDVKNDLAIIKRNQPFVHRLNQQPVIFFALSQRPFRLHSLQHFIFQPPHVVLKFPRPLIHQHFEMLVAQGEFFRAEQIQQQ